MTSLPLFVSTSLATNVNYNTQVQAPPSLNIAFQPSTRIIRQVVLQGKPVIVEFKRAGDMTKMLSPKGVVLGEGAASTIEPLLGAEGAVLSLDSLAIAGLILTFSATFLTAFFAFTPDMVKEPSLIPNGKVNSLEAFMAATQMAGLNFKGHPELSRQFRTKLGRNMKPFILRANQLALKIKKGDLKPENATAILRAELEVQFLKQGKDVGTTIKLPQKPAKVPNINEPQRKFIPNPVPDVSPLSGIVIKQKPVPKVATLQPPHDPIFDELLKTLAKTHQSDVFRMEDIDEIAKTYGISKEAIRAARNGAENLQQTAARLAAARFKGKTGGADGTGRRRQKTITQRVKDIIKADRRVVLEWLHFLPTSERKALPDAIKQAILQKLNGTGASSRLRVRRNLGKPMSRRGSLSTLRGQSAATSPEDVLVYRNKPLTIAQEYLFKRFTTYLASAEGLKGIKLSNNIDFKALDSSLSRDDLKQLQTWNIYTISRNSRSLIADYKSTKEALKHTAATIDDVTHMFRWCNYNHKVDLKLAIDKAIAFKTEISHSFVKDEFTIWDLELFLNDPDYDQYTPRQIIETAEAAKKAIDKYCKYMGYVKIECLLREVIENGATIEEAAINYARTHELLLQRNIMPIVHNLKDDTPEIDKDKVWLINEDRANSGLTPEQAVDKYQRDGHV